MCVCAAGRRERRARGCGEGIKVSAQQGSAQQGSAQQGGGSAEPAVRVRARGRGDARARFLHPLWNQQRQPSHCVRSAPPPLLPPRVPLQGHDHCRRTSVVAHRLPCAVASASSTNVLPHVLHCHSKRPRERSKPASFNRTCSHYSPITESHIWLMRVHSRIQVHSCMPPRLKRSSLRCYWDSVSDHASELRCHAAPRCSP